MSGLNKTRQAGSRSHIWPSRDVLIVVGIVALVLAGCAPGSASTTNRSLRTPHPLLQGDGPPCRFVYGLPYYDIGITCVEVIYDEVVTPSAAPNLSALAFGPDGVLYLVRTADGTIWALTDTDGDTFPDNERLVASGLTLPTSVAPVGDSLYVLSVGGLLRLDRTPDGRFGDAHVLVRELPGDGAGFWPGSVRIGPDGRVYVSVGAACERCTDQPGQVVSYAPDGTDARVIATGLKNPRDFDWNPATGELWIADEGRVMPGADANGPPDELNRVPSDPGVNTADFGFAVCGIDPQSAPDPAACAAALAPAVTFPAQSGPNGLAFYTSDRYPFWQGDLLVALRGSWDVLEPTGYGVTVIGFGADGQPDGGQDWIAPTTEDGSTFDDLPVFELSLAGMGFFPFHPSDVVVGPEGWIYVAVEEGRILRYRPRPPAEPVPTATLAP